MTACAPRASTRWRDALRPLGEVIVVAPQTEASAIGHALTLRRPLRMEMLSDGVYEVDGTPTDCVNIAISQLYKPQPARLPDLVVSGINKGYNLGDDVTYSGTVAGALEGALLGIPGIAVSLERCADAYDFRDAAAAGARRSRRSSSPTGSRRGRFSTSTCRDSLRMACASRSRRSAITSP